MKSRLFKNAWRLFRHSGYRESFGHWLRLSWQSEKRVAAPLGLGLGLDHEPAAKQFRIVEIIGQPYLVALSSVYRAGHGPIRSKPRVWLNRLSRARLDRLAEGRISAKQWARGFKDSGTYLD
jgi:hypothetical protein